MERIIVMKKTILLIPFLLSIILINCSKEVISLNGYEKAILDNSLYQSIPLLQSESESQILKKNQIKSLSLVIFMNDDEPDSVTYIEYDTEGRMIYRTTTENVGAACLPYWHRQEFIYENNKLKKVNYYTFKYKTDFILEKWMIKDTSQLILFDWGDYSYNGDTTIIELGWAIWKFIMDENGNIINQTVLVKTNNQLLDIRYSYSGLGITAEAKDNIVILEPVFTKYNVENNIALKTFEGRAHKHLEEYVYDSNGLPLLRILKMDGETKSKAVVSYSYY